MERALYLLGALGATIGTIILIVALAPVSTSASVARPTARNAVTPTSGQTLPLGTEIQGTCIDNTTPAPDCDPETGCPVGTRIVHDVTGTDLYEEQPVGSGNWVYDTTFDPSDCTETLDAPGHYQLAIVRQYYVETWDGTDWVDSDEQDSITYVEFTIGAAGQPCDDEGAIKSVWTQSGSSHGLKGKVLRNGQTIVASERMEITLGDDSVIRLDKGSRLNISCKDLATGTNRSWRERIGLMLGSIWAKIASRNDPDYQIHTVRAATGPRGTYFKLSYEPAKRLTTLHTLSGTVSLTNLFGKVKKTVVVHAGQTATQRGDAPPQLRSH